MTRFGVHGWGALSALGGTVGGFRRLLAGEDGFGPPPDWGGFPAEDGIPPRVAAAHLAARERSRYRTTALALTALEEAAPLLAPLDPTLLGLVCATTTSGMPEGELAIASHLDGQPPRWPGDFLNGGLPHRPAEALRAALGLRGPVVTVSTACTSGSAAFGVAQAWLAAGVCRHVLVVGADALCRTTCFGFRSLGVVSRTRCRPFDEARDGMALGEAAAWVLLGPEGPPFSLVGAATRCDAVHLTAPDPGGSGLERAIRAALGELDPGEVDHVNAHGTATLPNDAAEAVALRRVVPGAAVSATKGATGHTLGAAGVLEAVFLLQSMEAGVIPPVVGLAHPIEGVDVAATGRPRTQRIGLSVNLAFGGHNAAVVFAREPR